MEYPPIFISYRGSGASRTDGETREAWRELSRLFGAHNVFWAPESMKEASNFETGSVEGARSAKLVLAFMAPDWEHGLTGSYMLQELEAALDAGVPVYPVLVRGKASFDKNVVPQSLHSLIPTRGFPFLSEGPFSVQGNLRVTEIQQEVRRLAGRMVEIVPALKAYTDQQWRRWPVEASLGEHPGDWEDGTPEADRLIGRHELEGWERDLVQGDLRLLALIGEGGLGKTMSAEALWRRVLEKHVRTDNRTFDLAAWISFKGAPQSAVAIAAAILEWVPPEFERTDRPLQDFERLCRDRRCFFVLDNLEDAMVESPGRFVEAYADLDPFLAILSGPKSRATTVLTSREVPASLRLSNRVRVEALLPLSPDQLVDVIEQDVPDLISGVNRNKWIQVSTALEGNPYVAVLVGRLIKEEYHGDPAAWLAHPNAPKEAENIYEWHWKQFGKAGMEGRFARELLLWLAVYRAPIRESELRRGLWSDLSKQRFERTRSELGKRFPIYTLDRGASGDRAISVHSYILEYSAKRVVALSGDMITLGLSETDSVAMDESIVSEITDQIVQNPEQFEREVEAGFLRSGPSGFVLIDHPIVMATAPTGVRRLQREAFLEPVVKRLRERDSDWSRERLHHLLRLAARKKWGGYLAGNLLDILAELDGRQINALSAPGLRVRQADLRGIQIHDTDLSGAHFQDIRITQSIGQIRALAVSPDGEHVVAGDDTGVVTTWRIGEESPTQRHIVHDGATIHAVAISLDGQYVASACSRGSVWIWPDWHQSEDDLYPLSPPNAGLPELHGTRKLRALAFDKAGRLATSAEGPTVWSHDLTGAPSRMIFDLGDTPEGETPPDEQRINTLTYASAKDTFFAGTKNGHVYEISGDPSSPFFREVASEGAPAHANQVWALAVSSDQTLLATGGADGFVRVWSMSDHRLVFEEYHPKLRSDARSEVFCLAFLPDTHLLVSGNENGTIAVWDVEKHASVLQIGRRGALEGHDLRVRAVVGVAGLAGPLFITGGFDRRLIAWTATGERLAVVEGYANGLMALAEAGNVLFAGYEDGHVLAWANEGSRWESRSMYDHTGPVFCAAVNPQTQQLVTGGRDGSIQMSSLAGKRRPTPLGSHAHWVWSLDIAPDGQRVATCSEDGDVLLWDPLLKKATPCRRTGGADSDPLEGSHTNRARVVRFHPDPTLHLLASGGYDNAVRLWDARTGRPLGVMTGARDWVCALAFSRDGWVVAAWGEGAIRAWRVEHLLSLEGALENAEYVEWDACEATKNILHLAFLPDGRLLSAGEDACVHVWTRTGDTWQDPARTYSFTEHHADVNTLSPLTDGRIASGDANGEGWVWSPDPGGGGGAERFAPLLPYEGLNVSGAARVGTDGTHSDLSDGESETFESLGAKVRN